MAIKVYHNLRVGEVPPTPNKTGYDSPYLDSSTAQLVEVAEEYGFPISYAQESNGQLIQNILPIKNTENKQISTSSIADLDLHTELAFHPYKPDYVLLFCLRGDPAAVTTYAHVLDIVAQLDEETLEVLQQPLFITSLDLSFRMHGEPNTEFILPILKKYSITKTLRQAQISPITYWTMTYDKALMVGTNEIARNSLITFQRAVEKSIKEVTLKTGDLLVLNNEYIVHGRRHFKPRYDGTDRWVRRIMVRKQLPPPSEIFGHIVSTKFI